MSAYASDHSSQQFGSFTQQAQVARKPSRVCCVKGLDEFHMIVLATENTEQALTAGKEATRSASELVPTMIRNAGPRAVESFLCFFAQAKSKHTSYVHRTAANHFFIWCDEAGLTLDKLKAGHADGFFEAKRDQWKRSTRVIYCHSLQKLFGHLEADRIIERSPFVGVTIPRPARANAEPKVSLAQLKSMVSEIDGDEEGSEFFNAMMVVLYPIVIGGMDYQAISEFAGIPLQEVELYGNRLRANGCWTKDDKISVDDTSIGDDSHMVVEVVLQTLCAKGMVERQQIDGGEASLHPSKESAA